MASGLCVELLGLQGFLGPDLVLGRALGDSEGERPSWLCLSRVFPAAPACLFSLRIQ